MKISNKFLPVLILCTLAIFVKSQSKTTMNNALSPKQKNLITISSYTAKGDLTKLKPALNAGLDAGVTVNEIRESLVHLYAYCGFPRSLRGLMTFMEVLKERKAKGITDQVGAEASAITDKREKYERGKDILAALSGVKESGPKTGYAAFAPEIEVFLKEHLFADIFERDVLSYQERELVTVSVLSSIGGVEPMLSSHLGLCLNVGLTPAQLQEFIAIIKITVNKKDAASADAVLTKVLAKKVNDAHDSFITIKRQIDTDMKNTHLIIFACAILGITSCSRKQEAAGTSSNLLFPKGKQITNDNFTGTAYLHMMVAADSLNPITIGNVSFDAGARSKWHLHPGGQILLVTDGVGYYQEKGQPKKVLRKGDVIKCPPNVAHWHGASADTAFVQLAITSNQNGGAVWLDAVSDEDYRR